MNTAKPTLGQRIAQARRKSGQTQAAVSAQVGKHAGYIASLESDQRLPSLAALVDVAAALGVTVDELVKGVKLEG